jgi:hypothetical protein
MQQAEARFCVAATRWIDTAERPADAHGDAVCTIIAG